MFGRGMLVDYVAGNQYTFDRSASVEATKTQIVARGGQTVHVTVSNADRRFSACAVASSAGKKHSRASSERVTSMGVPKTVVVLMKLSLPSSVTSWSGTNTPALASRGGGI